MEKAKLMQLEIEKKRKLPQNVKDSISTNIFQDLIAALIIMTYLVSINIMYYKFDNTIFEKYMKFFALGIIIITVIDFEIAYRKDSLKYTLIGIELLTCSVLSLYIPYIYLHTTNTLRNNIMILPALLLVYYFLKALAVYKQKQIYYQSNLSDVKEIVKDSENISYIEEESRRSFREKTKREEEIREKIIKQQVIRKQLKNKEQHEKQEQIEITETKSKKQNEEKIISYNNDVEQEDEDIVKKVIIKNKKIRRPVKK